MAVPTSEAVSEEPIQLTIKSSRVPRFIIRWIYLAIYKWKRQTGPIELKTKIRDLCEKYLTALILF